VHHGAPLPSYTDFSGEHSDHIRHVEVPLSEVILLQLLVPALHVIVRVYAAMLILGVHRELVPDNHRRSRARLCKHTFREYPAHSSAW
jgi:hypothetical protein